MLKLDRHYLRTFSVFVIGSLCGTLGGGYYGFSLAMESSSTMAAQNAYYRSIIAVNDTASTLSNLAEGRTDEALAQLDRQLDFTLSDLAVYRAEIKKSDCEPRVVKAISSARTYRAAHPSSTQEPRFKAVIEDVLHLCAQPS